jgi:hypothetical protein
MYHSLKALKIKIHALCDTLLFIPNSYVSVITYSGHNQTERILSAVKCDHMTFQMNRVHEVIDSGLYIKGVTVISEPLNQAIDICQTLASVCEKHHIALFTDGCLVPLQWSSEKEENKCFDVARYCRDNGIFLNAVGFGQYYDRDFLNSLVSIAGNGAVLHIDYITDYFDVILKAINQVNEDDMVKIDLTSVASPEKFNKIFNIGTSQMDSHLSLRTMNPLLDTFAVIDADYIMVDNEEYNFPPDAISVKYAIEDFYYSLARYYLTIDDLDNYEFIVKLLGDIGLYEQTQNCFSFIEKGNAINKVTDCLFDINKRYLRGKQPEINKVNEDLCILEILNLILNDNSSMLYWDMNTPYHRVTQKTNSIEDSVQFTRDPDNLIPISSVTIGSEKLNIGIKVKINGLVTNEVTGHQLNASIQRDYNIVNGGNINVPYLNARLSESLFNQFKDQNILILNGLNSYIETQVYTINLIGIKSVNKRILKSKSATEVATLLYEIAEAKCEQWAFNQIIKDFLGDKTQLDFSNLSFAEQELRSELRINEKNIYSPAAVEKDLTTPFEIYPARYFTWDIARFPETKVKENFKNRINQFIINSGLKSDDEIINMLNQLVASKKRQMRDKEFLVNSIRIASALINKSPFMWDEITDKAKKTTDKILERNMVVGGTVTIKKKLLDDKLLEQKSWTQMVKCN